MDPNTPSVKPAWLTTEFWITVIPVVVVLIKLITGKDIHGVDITGLATLAVGISTAAYAISRALQKKAVIQAQAGLAAQKMAIAREVQASADARQHEKSLHGTGITRELESGLVDGLEQRIAALELATAAKPVARKVAKAPAKKATARR